MLLLIHFESYFSQNIDLVDVFSVTYQDSFTVCTGLGKQNTSLLSSQHGKQ